MIFICEAFLFCSLMILGVVVIALIKVAKKEQENKCD